MEKYKNKIIVLLSLVATIQGIILSTIYIKKEIFPNDEYKIIFRSQVQQDKSDIFLKLDDNHGKKIQWETLQLIYPKLESFDYFPIKAFHEPDMKVSIKDVLLGIHHQMKKRKVDVEGIISEGLPLPIIIFGTFYKDGKVFKLRSRYNLIIRAVYLNESGQKVNKRGYNLQIGNLSFEEHLDDDLQIVDKVDTLTEGFNQAFYKK